MWQEETDEGEGTVSQSPAFPSYYLIACRALYCPSSIPSTAVKIMLNVLNASAALVANI
jgi:hypothetical protein